MKKKSLRVNAFLNGLQNLLNLLFPLITFPYVSRVLSVDGIGKYNFSSSIVSYFILIAGLGISRFAIREGAKLRNDRLKFSEFASRVFTINIVSTLVSYFLLAITLMIIPSLKNYTLPIVIFSLQIFFTTIGVDWIYIIYEEYSYITFRNILFKVISLILLLLFVKRKTDYLNYVWISVIGTTGSYILNFTHIKKICDISINWHFNWKSYLRPIFTIFGMMAAVTIYVSSDITILGFLKNDYLVGIYSISTKIYGMIGPMLSSIMAVTIPRLAMLMGQNRIKEYNSLLSRMIKVVFLILVPAVIGLIMMSKNIVLLIAGHNYLRSINSLKILSVALLFGTVNTIFVECILIPAKFESETLFSSCVAAMLNIILNFALIPIFDENGAALTTVIAEFTSMSMNMWFSRHYIKNLFMYKKIWLNLIPVIVGCIMIYIMCKIICCVIISLILQLILSVFLSIFVYILSLCLFRNKVAIELVKRLFRDRVY